MKRIRTFLILTLFLVSMTGSAFAAGANTEQQTAASYLREAGIMVGNETGDMMLDQGLTRAQMAAVLTRIVANPDHVEAVVLTTAASASSLMCPTGQRSMSATVPQIIWWLVMEMAFMDRVIPSPPLRPAR